MSESLSFIFCVNSARLILIEFESFASNLLGPGRSEGGGLWKSARLDVSILDFNGLDPSKISRRATFFFVELLGVPFGLLPRGLLPRGLLPFLIVGFLYIKKKKIINLYLISFKLKKFFQNIFHNFDTYLIFNTKSFLLLRANPCKFALENTFRLFVK